MTNPPASRGGGAPPALVRNIGRRSLSAQAREAILESIMNGSFENGRIPPEKDLAEMVGVSRTTVRSALQSLQDAGVIVRTRGRGTMVRRHARPSMLALQRLVGFSTMLEETGREATVQSSWELIESPPRELLEQLELEQPEPCHRVEKLFRADGEPAIWVLHMFPASYHRLDEGSGDEFPDWFEFGEQFGRARVDHAVVEIRAERADAKTSSQLGLKRGTPVIVLHEHHYSDSDELLGYSRVAVNQEYVTLQVLRTK